MISFTYRLLIIDTKQCFKGGDRDRDRGRGGFDRDDPDEDRTIGDWRKPRDGGGESHSFLSSGLTFEH